MFNSSFGHELEVEGGALELDLEWQEDEPTDENQMHALNGALLQSVFTRPPCVVQSSAFHRLEYILIAWFFGYGTPTLSEFLNSLIGVPSTENQR